jgi:hypothetical protein
MRATLVQTDELFAKVQAYTGLRKKSAVARQAYKAPRGTASLRP